MLLIGLGHKARHGKDSAAEAIKQYYVRQNEHRMKHLYTEKFGHVQTQVGIFKYAGALYAEVNDFIETAMRGSGETDLNKIFRMGIREVRGGELCVTQIPDWVVPDPNYKADALAPYGKHPKLLQWWGTDFRRRNFGENYWVDKMFASIPANLDIALISDVRFPNEADAIKTRGGYTVKITRLRSDGSIYVANDRPADHPSEVALDNYNWQFQLINSEGHGALLAEEAVTLAVYLKQLGPSR